MSMTKHDHMITGTDRRIVCRMMPKNNQWLFCIAFETVLRIDAQCGATLVVVEP